MPRRIAGFRKVQSGAERHNSGAKRSPALIPRARELSQARQSCARLKDAHDDFESPTISLFAYARGCTVPQPVAANDGETPALWNRPAVSKTWRPRRLLHSGSAGLGRSEYPYLLIRSQIRRVTLNPREHGHHAHGLRIRRSAVRPICHRTIIREHRASED